jgi:hypothetical protein
MLKQFIKDQKREMRQLHSNKLFQEFLEKANADNTTKKRGELGRYS